MNSRSFVFVLLQRVDAAPGGESVFTRPLLDALRDVGELFQKRGMQKYDTVFLAPSLPTDDLRRQKRIDWGRVEQELRKDEWWGGPNRRGFRVNQERLLPKIRTLIGAKADECVVTVSGALITPPIGWSYALWDRVDELNAIVSLGPMNPRYWGLESEDRMSDVRVVKQRARAALSAVVGRQLGLEACSNVRCFLFEPVMDLVQLDRMRELGKEHGLSMPDDAHYESLDSDVSAAPDGDVGEEL